MIGRLRGEIVSKRPPFLLLDVNGVGYEVEVPMSTFYDLPLEGETVMLLTHLVVRDDAHILYGFGSEAERALFRGLLKVSGVGAKMALVLLSGMSAAEFAACVEADDSATLTRLPGIGKKTAERLIIEMRDRLEKMGISAAGAISASAANGGMAETPVSEAVGALAALGYKPVEASRMVRNIECEGLSSEEIIRTALKNMATR